MKNTKSYTTSKMCINVIQKIRISVGIARLQDGDEVNLIIKGSNRGLYTILSVDWDNGYALIHTRAKNKKHQMYKKFWCDLNKIKLAGTYQNQRQFEGLLGFIKQKYKVKSNDEPKLLTKIVKEITYNIYV